MLIGAFTRLKLSNPQFASYTEYLSRLYERGGVDATPLPPGEWSALDKKYHSKTLQEPEKTTIAAVLMLGEATSGA